LTAPEEYLKWGYWNTGGTGRVSTLEKKYNKKGDVFKNIDKNLKTKEETQAIVEDLGRIPALLYDKCKKARDIYDVIPGGDVDDPIEEY
jgi:predicted phage-related endonuclease